MCVSVFVCVCVCLSVCVCVKVCLKCRNCNSAIEIQPRSAELPHHRQFYGLAVGTPVHPGVLV